MKGASVSKLFGMCLMSFLIISTHSSSIGCKRKVHSDDSNTPIATDQESTAQTSSRSWSTLGASTCFQTSSISISQSPTMQTQTLSTSNGIDPLQPVAAFDTSSLSEATKALGNVGTTTTSQSIQTTTTTASTTSEASTSPVTSTMEASPIAVTMANVQTAPSSESIINPASLNAVTANYRERTSVTMAKESAQSIITPASLNAVTASYRGKPQISIAKESPASIITPASLNAVTASYRGKHHGFGRHHSRKSAQVVVVPAPQPTIIPVPAPVVVAPAPVVMTPAPTYISAPTIVTSPINSAAPAVATSSAVSGVQAAASASTSAASDSFTSSASSSVSARYSTSASASFASASSSASASSASAFASAFANTQPTLVSSTSSISPIGVTATKIWKTESKPYTYRIIKTVSEGEVPYVPTDPKFSVQGNLANHFYPPHSKTGSWTVNDLLVNEPDWKKSTSVEQGQFIKHEITEQAVLTAPKKHLCCA